MKLLHLKSNNIYGIFFSVCVGMGLFIQPSFSMATEVEDAESKLPTVIFLPEAVNLPVRVDISSTEFINSYMPSELSNDYGSLVYAARIIENSHGQRCVGNEMKYGIVFPVNPEILTYLMANVNGKTVLEIGGASGESSIMLALAGAAHVYMNDITPQEINTFERHKSLAPPAIKNRLESILGDCLNLLTLKPDLQGRCQLVLCRNVFHFLKDADRPAFFEMLRGVLAPGGQIVFITNSTAPATANSELREFLLCNPHCTRFHSTTGVLHDTSVAHPKVLCSPQSVCEEDLDPLAYTASVLYTRKMGSKWALNQEESAKLTEIMRTSLNAAIKDTENGVAKVKSGKIEVLQHTMRCFMPIALADIFRKQGFVIQKTFGIDKDGHTVPAIEDEDIIDVRDHQPIRINQVGIIARLS